MTSPSPIRPTAVLATLLVALVGLLATLSCTSSVQVPGADLAITDVTVIDATGAPPRAGRTVLIEDGRIAAIADAGRAEVPDGARVLDGRGRYLVPGLWDMHVHAWNPEPFAEIYLRHGVTGVREMGTGMDPAWGGSEGVWDWRASVREGRRPGPRVVAAGFILNGGAPEAQGAPFFQAAPEPADGRRWVDSLAVRGADFIKVYSALSPAAFRAIAARAREHELTLAGHVPSRVGTRAAIRGGLRSVEHLYDILVATSTAEAEIRAEIEGELLDAETATAAAQLAERARIDRLIETHDPAKARALFAAFREEGTRVVPTLIASADPRCPEAPVPALDSAALAGVPAFLRPFVQLREISEEGLARSCRRFEELSQLVGSLERAGIPILAGSDGPNPGVRPGIGLHQELALLVRAGLTSYRALQAATRDPARFLGAADSLGTVEEGKLADLVLLEANPLEAIRNTRRIAAVLAGGEVVMGSEVVAGGEAGAESGAAGAASGGGGG